MSIQPISAVTPGAAPPPSPTDAPPMPAPVDAAPDSGLGAGVGAGLGAWPPASGTGQPSAADETRPARAADEARPARPSEAARRSRKAPAHPSLEEAVVRAVADAVAQRRHLARQVRDLPPPLDTRLALLASVAEIRTAIVPPSLTTLDRRR